MASCLKRRYPDEITAKIALVSISRKGDDSAREKRPVRAYRCATCNGWHLTSRAGRR